MCEVLFPDFLLHIVQRHPEGLQGVTGTGQFAKEVAETARNLSWEGELRDLVVSCLSIDAKLRPRIGDVLASLTKPGDYTADDTGVKKEFGFDAVRTQ